MVAKGNDYSAVKHIIGRMDGVLWYEHYVPKNFKNYWQYLDYFAISAKMPEQYQAPLDFIQPVIKHVSLLDSDWEKVEYLNDYLCSLLTYEKGKTAGVIRTFSAHSGELQATCGSYSIAYQFLCSAADIPCFTITSTTHAWNMVYADGQWLHVDAATNDLNNGHCILLVQTMPNHTDEAPEATAFLKELLVPGSSSK